MGRQVDRQTSRNSFDCRVTISKQGKSDKELKSKIHKECSFRD